MSDDEDARRPIERTQPTPYADDNYIGVPPPPPSRKRNGWILVSCILFILLVGQTAFGSWWESSHKPATVVKTVVRTVVRTVIKTPQISDAYIQRLSSPSEAIFLNAFSDALTEEDVTHIQQYTATATFEEICSTCMPTAVTYGWQETKTEITADSVEFSFPHDANLATPPPYGSCPTFAVNQYTNAGQVCIENKMVEVWGSGPSSLNLSHYQDEYFGFSCVSYGGSGCAWEWTSVTV
ncbi:MAG TPA: hypothetical protein VNE61_01840 [Ktedonobacteraceae bacterium]|nr:hypothetical protein [Ktedonobacteraceae bacterium]